MAMKKKQIGYKDKVNFKFYDVFKFSDLFLFLKTLYEVKASGLQLGFKIFRQPSTWHTIKSNYIKL